MVKFSSLPFQLFHWIVNYFYRGGGQGKGRQGERGREKGEKGREKGEKGREKGERGREKGEKGSEKGEKKKKGRHKYI